MSKEAMKLALEALNNATSYGSLTGADWVFKQVDEAIKALEESLAKQEQLCRSDGRCQYAIDSGAEGMGHCPKGKCVMPAKQEQGEPVAIELQGVQETIKEGGGFWCSCSGCHELNDGYDTGPVSKIFGCTLGNGCSECGGLGAVWDTTDYQAMADFMANPPQQRKPLTDEQINAISDEYLVDYRIPAGCALNFARDVEAAHGIKE